MFANQGILQASTRKAKGTTDRVLEKDILADTDWIRKAGILIPS
jgi:hypothetical protein